MKAIFDTSCSRDLTLIESCNEFIARYKQSQSTDGEGLKSHLPIISSACPGTFCLYVMDMQNLILFFSDISFLDSVDNLSCVFVESIMFFTFAKEHEYIL